MKQLLTGTLARWMLLLQEFEFDIHHCPGLQHAVAFYLSRLESGEPTKGVHDYLPDAEIFRILPTPPNLYSEDKWIEEMIHFLGTGLPPEYLPLDAKKRLDVRSQNFYLLHDTLYHKGTDNIWRRVVRKFEQDSIL